LVGGEMKIVRSWRGGAEWAGTGVVIGLLYGG
jgi:hypothetical protein